VPLKLVVKEKVSRKRQENRLLEVVKITLDLRVWVELGQVLLTMISIIPDVVLKQSPQMLILNIFCKDLGQNHKASIIKRVAEVESIDLDLKYLSAQVAVPMPLSQLREVLFHLSQSPHLNRTRFFS